MSSASLLPREAARLCAGVVREVSRRHGIAEDPAAVGQLIVTVARLYNGGLRDGDELLAAAMRSGEGDRSEV